MDVSFDLMKGDDATNLSVRNAKLNVRIQVRERKSRKSSKKSRRPRRLPINVSQVSRDHLKPIGNWTVLARDTMWLTFELPNSVVQGVLNSEDHKLTLRIRCDGCDKRSRLILCEKRQVKVKGRGKKKKKGRGEKQRDETQRDQRVKREKGGGGKKGKVRGSRPQHKKPPRDELTTGVKEITSLPFLIVTTRRYPSRRSLHKRDTRCESATTGDCCVKSLYVDFKDIGWDGWILAPLGYHANYCEGKCGKHAPLAATLTSHQKVTGRHGDEYPTCCVPTRTRALTIIHVTSDGTILRSKIPNMSVTECSCM